MAGGSRSAKSSSSQMATSSTADLKKSNDNKGGVFGFCLRGVRCKYLLQESKKFLYKNRSSKCLKQGYTMIGKLQPKIFVILSMEYQRVINW